MAKLKAITVGARRNVAHPASKNMTGSDKGPFAFAQLHSEVSLYVELGAKDKAEDVFAEYQEKAVELANADLQAQYEREQQRVEELNNG